MSYVSWLQQCNCLIPFIKSLKNPRYSGLWKNRAIRSQTSKKHALKAHANEAQIREVDCDLTETALGWDWRTAFSRRLGKWNWIFKTSSTHPPFPFVNEMYYIKCSERCMQNRFFISQWFRKTGYNGWLIGHTYINISVCTEHFLGVIYTLGFCTLSSLQIH